MTRNYLMDDRVTAVWLVLIISLRPINPDPIPFTFENIKQSIPVRSFYLG